MRMAALSQNSKFYKLTGFDFSPTEDWYGLGRDQIGSCNPPNGRIGGRKLPDDWSVVVALLPELDEFRYPEYSHDQEARALHQYYSLPHIPYAEEYYEVLDRACLILDSRLPAVPAPMWMRSAEAPLVFPYDVFLNCVSGINGESHPGYPFCLLYSTKGDVIIELDDLYAAVCDRWLSITYFSSEIMDGSLDPRGLLLTGCADPSLVSIKNECLKETKDDRIILRQSIVQEVIERALHTPSKNAWFTARQQTPFSAGFSFEMEFFPVLFDRFHGAVFKNDQPKFDTGIQLREELKEAEASYYTMLGASVWVLHALVCLAIITHTKTCLLMGGDLVVYNGGQGGGTGEVRTTKRNSYVRSGRSFGVQISLKPDDDPDCINQSDDCVETHIPGMLERYKEFGFQLREVGVTEPGEDIDFCSHYWLRDCVPLGQRVRKSFADLFYDREFSQPRLRDLVFNYCNHPEMPRFAAGYLLLRAGGNMQNENKQNYEPYTKGGGKGGKPANGPPAGGRKQSSNAQRKRGGDRVERAPVAEFQRVPLRPPRVTSSQGGRCCIEHTELVETNLQGTSLFNVWYGIALNPGLTASFPWGSNIGQAFEKYRIESLEVIYRTKCSTATTGSVLMAIDYNAGDQNPASEAVMATYHKMEEFSPWVNFSMKLDPSRVKDWRYTRANSVPTGQDVKTYDAGVLFIATTDGSSVPWGKIWLKYKISFDIPMSLPGSNYEMASSYFSSIGTTYLTPFGTSPALNATVNGIPFSAPVGLSTGSQLYIANPGNYLLNFTFSGTGIGTSNPTFSASTGSTVSTVNGWLVNAATNTATMTLEFAATQALNYINMQLPTSTTITGIFLRAAGYNLS